jgi:phospholipid transport system substrate-binding protein
MRRPQKRTLLRSVTLAVLAFSLATVHPASAQNRHLTPMEQVKKEINQALEILKNPKLKPQERTKEILNIVDDAVEWHEVSKRVLSVRWRNRTPQERAEFTKVFKEFVKANYASKFEKYSGEEISYDKEEIDDGYARVILRISSKTMQKPITMECRLIDENGKWMIYDILIEGVSMVNNYRIQINDILVNSSFKDLIEKLKSKQRKKGAA